MAVFRSISFLVLCLFAVKCLGNTSNGQTSNKCDKTSYRYFETRCVLCPLNAFLPCPLGARKLTAGMGMKKCLLGRFYGCVHICRRTVVSKVCCENYWGADCRPCPGMESGQAACFGNGQCSDLEQGNGTCNCNASFEGYACEICSDKIKFGSKCAKDCTCKNGQCDSGVLGSGTCANYTCKSGYHGSNCEIFEKNCTAKCSAYSHCAVDKNGKGCKCNPGYAGDGKTCTEIDPCKQSIGLCPKNADCTKIGPGRHKCVCSQYYTGDGKVCSAIDPCQTNHGGCPNNTQCNYLGPGKWNCTCLPGYENYSSVKGCTIIDLCRPATDCLALNSECVMTAPNVKECKCRRGYVGNGTVCYGNILQQIDELHGPGPHKNNFTHVKNIIKRHSDLTLAFTSRGPFTVFLPTDRGLESKLNKWQLATIINMKSLVHDVVLAHSSFAYLTTSILEKNGNFTTLKGWDGLVNTTSNRYSLQLSGHTERPSIISSDILASNGIIHVIDGPEWIPNFLNLSNTQSQTLWEIVLQRSDLKMFRELVQIAGMRRELEATSSDGFTLVAPVNEGFVMFKNGSLEFLKTPTGKVKLRAILRHHIFGLQIGITDLIYQTSLTSLAAEVVTVKANDKGAVFLAERKTNDPNKYAWLIETNILASNGILHVASRPLIPSFVQPIIQRYCYNASSTIVHSPCRPCGVKYFNDNCPNGTIKTGQIRRCNVILHRVLGIRLYRGCYVKCEPLVKPCCSGFYGADCLPCPGPVGNACFGKGKCSDGVDGDGKCTCERRFKGTACELCKSDDSFGVNCTQTCTCIHGTCDKQRNGVCVPGSCRAGYIGEDCAIGLLDCGRLGSTKMVILCSVHGGCYLNGTRPICLCQSGYDQVGLNCYEINPCLKAHRGGCHDKAMCTKTGPGQNNCSCSAGWTGDGSYCTPINYCVTPSRAHCHRNARCSFLGPGQASCECLPGYEGDGTRCQEINACLINYGGCSQLAQCTKTGPGTRSCSCRFGYLGDGFICLPSLTMVMKSRRELTTITSLAVKFNLVRYLSQIKNVTAFLPSDDAIANLDADKRKLLDIPVNVYFLGAANSASRVYTSSDLRNETLLPSLFKYVFKNAFINVSHTPSGEPVIGGIAKIIVANLTASNGILHIVDKVVFPNFVLKPGPKIDVLQGLCSNRTNFTEICSFIKKFKLEDEVKNCNICTIFAPTDQAFSKLHHKKYYKLTRTDILYHMTRHFISPQTVANGQQFETVAGKFYRLYMYLENGNKRGFIKVNDVSAQYLAYNTTWIIYGMDKVLKAVENTCFRQGKIVLKTICRPCRFTRGCRPGFRYAGREDCLYAAFGTRYIGCRSLCEKRVNVSRCCPGFWGKYCTACPGGSSNPCFGNGQCNDSTGHCDCKHGFQDVACSMCTPGHYGKKCQNCTCHGNATCDQSNGLCICPPDKKGLKCDEEANYTKCGNLSCHQHASCSKIKCTCDYGFSGNGTFCSRIDLCKGDYNKCSANARCNYDANTMLQTCTCNNRNYEGDGYYCRGKNLCAGNQRNCHINADCFYIGPGRAECVCKAGYSGSGKICEPINSCSQDHGGCSLNADCSIDSASLNVKCTCLPGYSGDGYSCIGIVNVFEVLQNDPSLMEFNKFLKKSSINEILSPENYVSIIAPVNSAFTSSSRRKRRSTAQLSDADLKHYIVRCVAISQVDVTKPGTIIIAGTKIRVVPRFVTVAGSWLNITAPMVINNKVNILSFRNATNGVILTVDKLLDISSTDHSTNKNMALIDVAKKNGYGKFATLLTEAGMLDITSNAYIQPLTMFWPSDDAISRLQPDIQERIFSGNYSSELRDVLNYHIIQRTKITTMDILRYAGGLSRRTREGSPLYMSCKGHRGDLYINDQSKIIQRDIEYQGGVAFGISEVLLPPGVAGRCDEIKYKSVQDFCAPCGSNPLCPPGSIVESVHINASCLYQGQYIGCRYRCVKQTKVEKCCKNFYGPDCQVCPGGVRKPCNARGICDDGRFGSGNCTCRDIYTGPACDDCKTPVTVLCVVVHVLAGGACRGARNPCSIFATCSTSRKHVCKCIANYEGDGYYCQEIDGCQKNNGNCSKHAVCQYLGPNLVGCRCRPGYVGDGYTCRALNAKHPCAINNGNCHEFARCTDGGGVAACKCREGFVGNGRLCTGNVKNVIYDVEDLSEFAKAFRKLSFGVEGNDLIRKLSSEKDFTVLAPINHGFIVKRMTINELKNHIIEGRLLPKPGKTATVLTLARNKITIAVSKDGRTIRINKIASVVTEYIATNGIVFVIDQIIPYKIPLPDTTVRPPVTHGPKVTTTATTTTGTSGTVSASGGKKSQARTIGISVGVVVVVVLLVIVVLYIIKRRRHNPAVKYNKNFESMFESEAYTEEDHVEDEDDYEHQMLQHPSSEVEATTVQNPTYTDADIGDELLEMTETSSAVPLTKHDAVSSCREDKC